ncbi:MAG TPA: GDSL-type esterase/lipase family protein [Gaiellaceae bacterium]|nr:GDSL-type esterase/lipase family protein [Gaiellaceae bacterium]
MSRAAPALLLVVLLAACGGSSQASGKPGSILVAALGDGITAGAPGYYPDHGVRKLLGFGDNPGSQWEYWAQQADPRIAYRNCGVFRERTDQIARRLASCARGANVLVIEGGDDDVRQGRPITEAATNLAHMVVRAKQLGVKVELAQLIPWNNGWPQADPEIRALNARIDRIGRAEHVPVLPFYSTLDDPSHPGRMKDAWTADGDYPSAIGYRRLGELAFHLP